mmetsp:Transcript_16112/g.33085  ORF Transcript_16112/g.33085 Transcript_16112/m.33085 type:complete len:90 (-) Transcript_16112:323-592(-)
MEVSCQAEQDVVQCNKAVVDQVDEAEELVCRVEAPKEASKSSSTLRQEMLAAYHQALPNHLPRQHNRFHLKVPLQQALLHPPHPRCRRT